MPSKPKTPKQLVFMFNNLFVKIPYPKNEKDIK